MSENKLHAALAAILRELEVPFDVRAWDNRLQIQKAVYLAQVAGVNLGYRFGWYVRGPYSSALADDYYAAAANLPALKDFRAGDSLKESLKGVKAIVAACPPGIPKAQWLESVASVDYLRRVQRRQDQDLKTAFETEKPGLATLFPEAKKALDDHGLKVNGTA